MRGHLAVLLVFLGLAQVATPQTAEHFSVPFVDTSAPGAPVEVATKQVVLDEAAIGNQLSYAWSGKVVLRNTSQKEILLLITSIRLAGRHNHGPVVGPGDGATILATDDRFFSQDTIQPGSAVTVWESAPGNRQVQCCIDPLENAQEPRALFQIRFVQFADGSTFGNPSDAEDDLAIRKSITSGIRRLLQEYTRDGEEGLDDEMKRQRPWSNTLIFSRIWQTYQSEGAAAAVAQAQQILALVEKREASARPPS